MALWRTWRPFAATLACMGLSVLCSLLGFGAFVLLRQLCLQAGYRWGILADMGSIGLCAVLFVLGGATLGVITGKILCCPEQKVSICGSVAAFLCGGFGSIGVLLIAVTLGIAKSNEEIVVFALAFLVVMPLCSVTGYDVVARITGKRRPRIEEEGSSI